MPLKASVKRVQPCPHGVGDSIYIFFKKNNAMRARASRTIAPACACTIECHQEVCHWRPQTMVANLALCLSSTALLAHAAPPSAAFRFATPCGSHMVLHAQAPKTAVVFWGRCERSSCSSAMKVTLSAEGSNGRAAVPVGYVNVLAGPEPGPFISRNILIRSRIPCMIVVASTSRARGMHTHPAAGCAAEDPLRTSPAVHSRHMDRKAVSSNRRWEHPARRDRNGRHGNGRTRGRPLRRCERTPHRTRARTMQNAPLAFCPSSSSMLTDRDSLGLRSWSTIPRHPPTLRRGGSSLMIGSHVLFVLFSLSHLKSGRQCHHAVHAHHSAQCGQHM